MNSNNASSNANANIGRQLSLFYYCCVTILTMPLGKTRDDAPYVLVRQRKAQGRNKQAMKRYGNLFENLCSMDNIAMAHQNARRGKAHYKEVRRIDAKPAQYLGQICEMLKTKTFRTAPYVKMVKNEYGKKRIIHKLPYFPDRIVHHAIVQVAGGIWNRVLIRDTYACIVGRGIHDGLRRIKKALHDYNGTRYCLKMDVKQFYHSVDHDILKETIRHNIKDCELLWLIDEIIDSSQGRVGVPIGNYLSQFFGNLYLSSYDHWMKEINGCQYYYRYCDDVVILHESKQHLHELKRLTLKYWVKCLKLDLKSNWQVFPVQVRGIDFLGYRFFHGYILLRKSIASKFKRRMKMLKQSWELMAPVSVSSTIASYNGWLKHANCRNLAARHINEEISQINFHALEQMTLVAENARAANRLN